ncbi:MAG: NADH:ubiquinone reductase (Na(+)-transporting) subunit B [Bryobacterales bacterium]
MSNPLDPEKLFGKGGPLERLYPLWEANDTILFTPGSVTKVAAHVRDALDLKRLMITVVVALVPCILFGVYNIGYQAHLAIEHGAVPLDDWQTWVYQMIGLPFSSSSIMACVIHGLLYYLPVLIVTGAIGGNIEAASAIIRRHEINEGFLVTWMLFPLILPPTVPLWQVALGIAFGVIVGKEIFGGTGMNILNPALTSRAFLFFAYPAQMSGDRVWIAADTTVDGASGATWLANAAAGGMEALLSGAITWWDAFLGFIPGSMGETSTLACLLGAVLLIITGVGSWRIMLGAVLGSFLTVGLLNMMGSQTNPLMNVPFYWQMVLGGWAFGVVFMATDPVSAAHSIAGKYVYGFFIGVLAILIRVVNPAYPEGMMLAILFMNLFAAFIDYWVIQANVKRRAARYAA